MPLAANTTTSNPSYMFDFESEGKVIFAGRNTIKLIEIDGRELVVKRFRRPNLIQKIVYTWFKKTKAYRSYNNAKELINRGFDTPKPVEYVETHRLGLVDYCYYVCERTDNPPIEDLTDRDDWSHELALAFAGYAAELHEKGVLHHDLNDTNVLYDADFRFSLIDLNRMCFYPLGTELPLEVCLDNLTRFTGRMDLFEFVVREYAKVRGLDIEETTQRALAIKRRHDRNWYRRKRILHPFRSTKAH